MSTVKRIGVRLSPPSLLLVYQPPDGGGDRLRKMPVKSLTAAGGCGRVAEELRRRHAPHLDTVPQRQLLRMLRIIQEGMAGGTAAEIVPRVDAEFRVDPEEDLNVLSTEQLEKKKAAMEEGFVKRVVRPGDADFVYDVREDFGGPKQASGWDEDDEDVDDDLDDW